MKNLMIISMMSMCISGCGGSDSEPVTEEPVTEEPVTEAPVTEDPVTYSTFASKDGVYFKTKGRSVFISNTMALISSGDTADVSINDYSRLPVMSYIFDDSYSSHYEIVAPAFENNGVKAGFAVYVSGIGKSNHMTFDQLLDLQSRGFEIINHSQTHKSLVEAVETLETAEVEVLGAKTILESHGIKITTFVSPFSTTNEKYMNIVRENHAVGYTIHNNKPLEPALWSENSDLQQLHRYSSSFALEDIISTIDVAALGNGYLTLYDHDIDRGATSLEKVETIISHAINVGVNIETPANAARLYKLSDKTVCNYSESLKKLSAEISCKVADSVNISASLLGDNLEVVSDGIYNWLEILDGSAKVNAYGCNMSGTITKTDDNGYTANLTGQCTGELYFASHAGVLFSALVMGDKIKVQSIGH